MGVPAAHVLLHDSSVWQTHLHVAVHRQYAEGAASKITDVVSTRDLFGLMRGIGLGRGTDHTICRWAVASRPPHRCLGALLLSKGSERCIAVSAEPGVDNSRRRAMFRVGAGERSTITWHGIQKKLLIGSLDDIATRAAVRGCRSTARWARSDSAT